MPDESIIIPIDISMSPALKQFSALNQAAGATVQKIEKDFINLKAASAITMTADGSMVVKTIAQLKAELAGFRAQLKGTLGVDEFNRLNTAIANTKAQIKGMSGPQVKVDVDISGAQAKIVVLQHQFDRLQRLASLPNLNTGQQARLNGLLQQTQRELIRVNSAAQMVPSSFRSLSASGGQAAFALTNFGRIAQDLPYGMIGIANNITPLVESMQRLSVQAKETGVSVGKQLLQSLKGGGGLILAVSVLTSVMQFAALGLSAFSRGSRRVASGSDDAKKQLTGFADAAEEAGRSFASAATKATSLVSALGSNTLNLNERKKALKELKSINQEFFGSLREEDGLIKGLQSAYDGYILRLKEIGKTKALESQLTKLFDKKLQLELQIDPKFISATNAELQKMTGGLQKELEALGGKVDVKELKGNIKEYTAETDKATGAVNEWGNKTKEVEDAASKNLSRRMMLMQMIQKLQSGSTVGFLEDQFNKTGDDINKIDLQINALSDLLKKQGVFDIEIPTEKPNDAMDEILARARAFVKQFGDIFVVPDLEESFTNTKDKIMKLAVKLLDDVSKGTLKIKLPGIVFEFEDGTVPVFEPKIDPNFKFDEEGKIRKAFMDELQAEFEKPFDVNVDVSVQPNFISKFETEQIDKLVEGFVEMGDRGVKKLGEINSKTFGSTNDLINAQIDALKKLQEEYVLVKELTQGVGESFASVFDAILKGKDPIKAFFESLLQELEKVIAKLIATKIAAFLLNAAFPGAGGVVSVITGGRGGGIFGNRVAYAGGGGGVANINVTGQLRGSDIYLSGHAGAAQVGRAGG